MCAMQPLGSFDETTKDKRCEVVVPVIATSGGRRLSQWVVGQRGKTSTTCCEYPEVESTARELRDVVFDFAWSSKEPKKQEKAVRAKGEEQEGAFLFN